jgi:hypothetical protein
MGIRYTLEFSYIFALSWTSLGRKIPSLVLNCILDTVLILIIILYAYNRLRKLKQKRKSKRLLSQIEGGQGQGQQGRKEGQGQDGDLLIIRENSPSASSGYGPFRLNPKDDELDDISLPDSPPIVCHKNF